MILKKREKPLHTIEEIFEMNGIPLDGIPDTPDFSNEDEFLFDDNYSRSSLNFPNFKCSFKSETITNLDVLSKSESYKSRLVYPNNGIKSSKVECMYSQNYSYKNELDDSKIIYSAA